MRRTTLLLIILLAGCFAIALSTTNARAAPHATYTLGKSSVGSGGSGSAGIYTLLSSIGQPDAGEVSAGIYTLGGGFWGGGVIVPAQTNYDLFLPLVLR